MNEKLQPHESHVPFVLQFMIDHHLFGMNHIHLANVKFRITGSTRECVNFNEEITNTKGEICTWPNI